MVRPVCYIDSHVIEKDGELSKFHRIKHFIVGYYEKRCGRPVLKGMCDILNIEIFRKRSMYKQKINNGCEGTLPNTLVFKSRCTKNILMGYIEKGLCDLYTQIR